ncbi:mitochondrial import protein Pam17 [Cyathus striatus]|nr:mitochondrial import protein Pam17 [Cyathus striatus]
MHTTILRPLSLGGRSLSRPTARKTILSFSRLNSTTSKSSTKEAEAIAETAQRLSWPQYLTIRKSLGRWKLVSTVPSCILGFVGGAAYFSQLDTDPLKPILGIDPFFFYGLCTLGCLGMGYLVGPSIGTSLWRFSHRRILPQIDARDREFFHRIAKRRVDANLQSPTQPIPDYYGERIGSLHEYRQWLRDQAKYRRKALLPEHLD